jgi:hypothetical protein
MLELIGMTARAMELTTASSDLILKSHSLSREDLTATMTATLSTRRMILYKRCLEKMRVLPEVDQMIMSSIS